MNEGGWNRKCQSGERERSESEGDERGKIWITE